MNLVPAMKDTIYTCTDLTVDYADIALDAIFDNDVLKEIPIVSTIASLCKVGYNLHERNLIKQTIAFIDGYNSGSLSQGQIDKHRKELDDNPEKAEKELGRVIIILGMQTEERQSEVMGKFYSAYVKGAISWDKFCELSEANRRMFVSDYGILKEAARNNGLKIGDKELYQVDRLISLGLLQNGNRLGGTFFIDIDKPSEEKNDIIITSFGKTFVQHMVE